MTDQEIRVSGEIGVVWHFDVPSSASTFAEQAVEMENHCEQLFALFGNFITPTEFSYSLDVYPDNQPIESLSPGGGNEKSVRRELADEDGISWTDFAESMTIDGSGTRFISGLNFDHNRLRVRLGDEDVYIEQEDCVRYHKGEPDPSNFTPPDPLSLSVSFWPTSEDSPIESEYMYTFSVGLRSDIWIKKSDTELTDTDRANRAYLGEFLSELDETLSPVIVKCEEDGGDFWYDLSLDPGSGIGTVPNDPADEFESPFIDERR
ncbi:hypothetical protein [Haloarcula argentinensis]|uniref:Halobacterial output domain-containing protein n=1 Tax=Haloarcula argentinensis TaxID=43776 RepID=A0ABU2F709_HALAR|nr:hypothetical protein [Haloarcula argentinensis]EMA26715.1 hypothetical protein C443_00062 [Haloarcula argentinensis DSM 12282]MDS0255806.1 hypothetical protein [Haloarcula argentinensis]